MRVAYFVIVGIPFLIGIAWGIAEIAFPAVVIRWRRVTADNQGTRAAVRDWFDDLLGTGGDRPWEKKSALRRVRLLGIGLLAMTLLLGYVFLIVAAPE